MVWPFSGKKSIEEEAYLENSIRNFPKDVDKMFNEIVVLLNNKMQGNNQFVSKARSIGKNSAGPSDGIDFFQMLSDEKGKFIIKLRIIGIKHKKFNIMVSNENSYTQSRLERAKSEIFTKILENIEFSREPAQDEAYRDKFLVDIQQMFNEILVNLNNSLSKKDQLKSKGRLLANQPALGSMGGFQFLIPPDAKTIFKDKFKFEVNIYGFGWNKMFKFNLSEKDTYGKDDLNRTKAIILEKIKEKFKKSGIIVR